MKTIKQLKLLLHTNNITYSFTPLPESILGYFQNDTSGNYIMINSVLEKDKNLYKCILAEEIGHFFTTIGINESLEHITYRTKLYIDKQEEKAIKWACEYLINTDILLQYLSTHIYANLYDLIDFFEVTEKFMIQKLDFMSKMKLHWHIKDKHYLCLSNLPSVYIATFFDTSLIKKI